MPFQQYAPYFGPEALETLTAAFNETLVELSAAGVDTSTEQKLALVKKRLAQRLLVSATAGGVRDLNTLKEQALRSLGGGLRLGEETLAPKAA
jgi:kynurenine formamidase